jgi:hypothetical protein
LLLEEAGFKQVQIYESFGNPHQVYIATCTA